MNRLHTTALHIVAVAVAVAVAMSATAVLSATIIVAQTTESGGLLRDKAGMTLYTFDKDLAGESRCFDKCASAWPPFMAADGAKAKDGLTLVAERAAACNGLSSASRCTPSRAIPRRATRAAMAPAAPGMWSRSTLTDQAHWLSAQSAAKI